MLPSAVDVWWVVEWWTVLPSTKRPSCVSGSDDCWSSVDQSTVLELGLEVRGWAEVEVGIGSCEPWSGTPQCTAFNVERTTSGGRWRSSSPRRRCAGSGPSSGAWGTSTVLGGCAESGWKWLPNWRWYCWYWARKSSLNERSCATWRWWRRWNAAAVRANSELHWTLRCSVSSSAARPSSIRSNCSSTWSIIVWLRSSSGRWYSGSGTAPPCSSSRSVADARSSSFGTTNDATDFSSSVRRRVDGDVSRIESMVNRVVRCDFEELWSPAGCRRDMLSLLLQVGWWCQL